MARIYGPAGPSETYTSVGPSGTLHPKPSSSPQVVAMYCDLPVILGMLRASLHSPSWSKQPHKIFGTQSTQMQSTSKAQVYHIEGHESSGLWQSELSRKRPLMQFEAGCWHKTSISGAPRPDWDRALRNDRGSESEPQAQGAQYGLTKEYTSNLIGIHDWRYIP